MAEAQTRFTAEGLVIKSVNVGENDRLITVFTREMGIIKAYVPGVKAIKSKRSAATSLLTYSAITFNRKGETYRVTEASVITGFFTSGTDIDLLCISQYFCEIADLFAVPGTPNDELFRLILNSLHFLNKEKRYPPLIKAITEFRAAVISGYMPDLVACRECGAFENAVMYFDIINGDICCDECTEETENLAILDPTLLSAIRHIAYCEFKKLYAFDIPKSSSDVLSHITERYLLTQTDHRFQSLELYRKMNN